MHFFDLSIHHLRNHHQFCNKERFEIILQVLDCVLTLLSTPISNLFVCTCMDDLKLTELLHQLQLFEVETVVDV